MEKTRTPIGSSMLIASAASSRDPELQWQYTTAGIGLLVTIGSSGSQYEHCSRSSRRFVMTKSCRLIRMWPTDVDSEVSPLMPVAAML